MHAPGTPLPKTAEQVREQLEKLRTERPQNYAYESARLLKQLERLSRSSKRYALT